VKEFNYIPRRCSLIEKAGTGIRRMREDARKHKCPEPKFTVNGFFTATFWPNVEIARKITPQVTPQVTLQATPVSDSLKGIKDSRVVPT
jgi:predicted HTH transcriptional regulator